MIVQDLLYQLDGFERSLQARALSPRTLRLYKSRLRNFLEYLDLYERTSSVSARDLLDDYRRWMRTELEFRDSTINLSLSIVSQFLTFVGEPFQRIPKYRAVTKPFAELSHREESMLLRHLFKSSSTKLSAITLLFLRTGVGIDELISLNSEDVITTPEAIKLRISGKKARIITVPADASRALSLWLNEREQILDSGPLFVNRAGRRLSASGIDFCLKSLGHKIRLELCASNLRETFRRQSTELPAAVAHVVPSCELTTT